MLIEVARVLADVPPIDFTYGPVTDMGHPPGVVYAISPHEPFFALRQMIHATSAFAGQALPRANRSPHMTLAEFITAEQSAELLRKLKDLPPGTFRCNEVVFAVPDETFHFSPMATIALGGSVSSAGAE